MNNEVLLCTKMESLETIMTHQQLRWIGHLLAWMPDIQLPKQIHFSEHVSGKRPHRATCRRFKDQLKNTLLGTEIFYGRRWKLQKEPIGEEQSTKKKEKISICWKHHKTNRRDKESPKKSQCIPRTILHYHAVVVDVFSYPT